MKKAALAVLVFTMIIFLINPLSSDASGDRSGSGRSGSGRAGSSHSISGHSNGGYIRGGYGRGGYGRSGYWRGGYVRGGYWGWWAPWAVIGGAAVLAPYYDSYYNSVYYESAQVVDQEQPPVYVNAASSAPPSLSEKIFVYPKNGQSEEQQAKDRYGCHIWAVGQTHYDPTQPTSGMPRAQLNQMRADYKRAMSACLDGRGYSMR